MSNFGIKISLPEQEVTEKGLKKFILNTEYSNLKVKLGETPRHFEYVSYTYTSEPSYGVSTTLVTIPHGYTYAPLTQTWLSFDNNNWYIITSRFNLDFMTGSADFYICSADSTNVYIRLRRDGPGPPVNPLNGTTVYFKYMIFTDDAS
jgi:hypothetical protein